MTDVSTRAGVRDGVGSSASRPDGGLKVRGEFAFSSDLWMDGMLWGATLRSPHAHARITRIETAAALKVPGVFAVLTHEDVPGVNAYGLEHRDQPVLAADRVRYQGEAVALVAADHPETARRALALVEVDYDELPAVTDAHAAVFGETELLHPDHPDGNVVRHVRIRRGSASATAPVVVTGDYEVGMQDQAFLGPESGLAVPAADGGVDLYVATQWLHVDRGQVAYALGLDEELVRITLAGVGGAFGAREDLSMQVHASMLALRTRRPVKMVYSREESFFGHVHRHPARMHYEHGADESGRLVYVKASIVLDGGAYASSSPAVVANAATLGAGPYVVPNVSIDCYGAYTNNPPCGAMRGFGAVQAAFGYESQMDRLAAALGMDPAEVRILNGLSEGDRVATGQVLDSAAPVAELRPPRPRPAPARRFGRGRATSARCPAASRTPRTARASCAVSATGSASRTSASPRASTTTRRPGSPWRSSRASRSSPCTRPPSRWGRGLSRCRRRSRAPSSGSPRCGWSPPTPGSAAPGPRRRHGRATSPAAPCRPPAARSPVELISRAALATDHPVSSLALADGSVVSAAGEPVVSVAALLGHEVLERTVEWRHRPTTTLDPETGQGSAHVQFAFAAHRAVVDVDIELGLVKVVALDCAQDVGHAINPEQVLGQIHGGSAQGLGLAVMEEIQVVDGLVRNPSFTDYLIPTVLDMPPMRVELLELADPHSPYGLRGVGEPPTISATPAIVAAIRAATGLALTRVPVRPEHLTGT